jgi:hypothetical protein
MPVHLKLHKKVFGPLSFESSYNRWYIGESSNQFIYMIRIPVTILGGLGMYYILDEWYL